MNVTQIKNGSVVESYTNRRGFNANITKIRSRFCYSGVDST